MTPSLVRNLRRRRSALIERLGASLSVSLDAGLAREEARAFLELAEAALLARRPRAIRRALRESVGRWTRLGLDPRAAAHALLTLVLPGIGGVPAPAGSWSDVGGLIGPLLDAVPQPMFVVDLERRVRFANRPAARVTGLDRPTLASRRLDDLLAPESRGWVERQFGAADDSPVRARFGRVRMRGPRELDVFASSLMFEVGGQPAGWFVTITPEPDVAFDDPTVVELLQREKGQKDKFAALLTVSHTVINSLELGTILHTIVRQVRQVIQADECTVFLYDEREQVLKPEVCEVEEYREEVMSVRLRLGEGITGSIAQSGKGEIVNHAQRDPRAVQVPGTPLEDDSSLLCVPLFSRDKIAGVITLVRVSGLHFTEGDLELAKLFAGQCSAAIANARLYESMKAAYEELRETQAQLVQSAKLNALGEMAGGVAHDFNNILAAILGRTQLMLQSQEQPELRRQLQVIEQAALDGAHTVRRVQEFTRVRNDERFETLDVNQVLLGVLELTRPAWEASSKRRGVSVGVARRLEAVQTIAGNASELREVFTNLVLNAVDAMPEGGQLQIDTEDRGDQVQVRIADTGVGMDERTREKIFDPFFTTKTIKGTGLGLSVAYGIVTRHHGTIEVESEPGVGTRFTLVFPVGEVVRPHPSPEALGPLPNLRVLVVDDEEPVLSVLTDLLRTMGQDVRAALGGPAGLAACADQQFDVVFSDLGMPEVNGWDLALAVKSRWPGTSIVLVTGWGFQLEGGTAQAHGVDVIMPKPFSIEDVDRVLRQLGERLGSERRAA